MRERALQAVIFDIGGTLLHYHDPLSDDPRRAFRRITTLGVQTLIERLAQSGASLPSGDHLGAIIDRHIGEAYRSAMQELRGSSTIEEPIRAGLAEAGVAVSDREWADLRLAFYQVIDTIVFPRAGLTETLTTLSESGYRLALISNTYWAADLHNRHLAQFGVLDFIAPRIYSCEAPFVKPHPAIFNQALDTLELAPEQTVYVGDRLDVDIAGAQGVDMYTILIRSPYRSEAADGPLPENIVPDAVIDELPELAAALDRLESPGA